MGIALSSMPRRRRRMRRTVEESDEEGKLCLLLLLFQLVVICMRCMAACTSINQRACFTSDQSV